jgi:DNA modification methylase
MDLDLSDAKGNARRLAYADNRVAEVDLSWDVEAVKTDFEDGVDLRGLWSDMELQNLLDLDFGAEGDDAEVEVGDGTATVTKHGDIWILGEHRVVCGDSTLEEFYRAACGDQLPSIMVTDPPYGVEYDPEWRGVKDKIGKVLNDDVADWTPAWKLFDGDVAYVWHASLHISTVHASLVSAGFETRSLIIWAKPSLQISRGHYHWQHEPCWYAVRKGKSARWTGDRKQSTIWQMDVVSKASYGSDNEDDTAEKHGTQKPIEAMMRPMMNHGERGDVVYDPFLGSGTSVMAAERSGRRCVGIELSPEYVDAIVARWEKATGGKAQRG